MSDLSPQAILEAHRALARASTPEDERRAIMRLLGRTSAFADVRFEFGPPRGMLMLHEPYTTAVVKS